eukprot:1761850-Pleurochrysis_carterae.AAC.2
MSVRASARARLDACVRRPQRARDSSCRARRLLPSRAGPLTGRDGAAEPDAPHRDQAFSQLVQRPQQLPPGHRRGSQGEAACLHGAHGRRHRRRLLQ